MRHAQQVADLAQVRLAAQGREQLYCLRVVTREHRQPLLQAAGRLLSVSCATDWRQNS